MLEIGVKSVFLDVLHMEFLKPVLPCQSFLLNVEVLFSRKIYCMFCPPTCY